MQQLFQSLVTSFYPSTHYARSYTDCQLCNTDNDTNLQLCYPLSAIHITRSSTTLASPTDSNCNVFAAHTEARSNCLFTSHDLTWRRLECPQQLCFTDTQLVSQNGDDKRSNLS
jgi:hypothetical protein